MTDHPQAAPQPQGESETVAYSPAPEWRPEWARSAWLDPSESVPPTGTQPVQPIEVGGGSTPPPPPVSAGPSGRGGRGGAGAIVGAAVLSAILASGGTVLVLQSNGALSHPSGASGASVPPVTSAQPISIDENSAVIDAAAKVSPAVVRIIASGTATDQLGGTLPETGIG